MAKILVVEDDKSTNEAVVEYLNELGYETSGAFDGKQALEIFKRKCFDLVILDIMLPEITGVVVLSKIRENSDIPVLMLTAIDDEYMQILSFDGNADDYMTKPFSMIILGKRVQALLKRSHASHKSNTVQIENAVIDFNAYTTLINGKKLEMTSKEIELLKLFIQNKGIVLSRGQIMDSIWGYDAEILDRTIDTYIKNIRKKLGLSCISTVKGVGYRMENKV